VAPAHGAMQADVSREVRGGGCVSRTRAYYAPSRVVLLPPLSEL
jgi:hypothetical protein